MKAKAANLSFRIADDWGWPHAGVYGDQVIKTPTFDQLAKEGILFERAFVFSPSCKPCRNSILTGQQLYRLESGANFWSTLDVGHPNLMFLLGKAGYRIGLWPNAWGPVSFQAGGYKQNPCGPTSTFDEFLDQRDKYRHVEEMIDVEKDTPFTKRIKFTEVPIDAAMELPGGREVRDMLTLKAALLEDRESIFKGIIEKLISYAHGRDVSFADRPHVDAIFESIAKEEFSLRAAIHAIVAHPAFGEK